MRVTLARPDGWACEWISNGHRAPLRVKRQQGGGGVLVWAGIIKDELVGPFQVEDWTQTQLPNLLPVFRKHFLQAVVQE